MLVDEVMPGGAIDAWNWHCVGSAKGDMVVVAGDRLLSINDQWGCDKMLAEVHKNVLVKLLVFRII